MVGSMTIQSYIVRRSHAIETMATHKEQPITLITPDLRTYHRKA